MKAKTIKCKTCGAEFDLAVYPYPRCGYCGAELLKKKATTNNSVSIPAPKKLPSGAFRGQIYMSDGKRISVTADTTKEYYRLAEVRTAEYEAGKVEAEKKAAEISLYDCIGEYIELRTATKSPETIRGYRTIQENRFKSIIKKNVHEITKEDVQKAIDDSVRAGLTAKTIKNTWGLVAAAMATKRKIDWRDDISLPLGVSKEKEVLSGEQMKVLREAVAGSDMELPVLLAMSGLRRSEILALRWNCFLPDTKELVVDSAMVFDENEKLVFKDVTKNVTSTRKVPIIWPELLAALNDADKTGEFIVNCPPNKIGQTIEDKCKEKELPVVSTHGLRHSWATYLIIEKQIPEEIVMMWGGWANTYTMKRVYTHAKEENAKKYQKQLIGVKEDKETLSHETSHENEEC